MTPSRSAWLRSARRLAVLGAVAALVLQSLAPPGYMPGSLSSGWPVMLCPEGLPKGFLGHEHHHGHGSPQEDPGLGQHCPLGGMLDTAAPVSAIVAASAPDPAPAGAGVWYSTPPLAKRDRSHPSRAPPPVV